jgi:pimeloyl-ACP methyl ester carboxylesterase
MDDQLQLHDSPPAPQIDTITRDGNRRVAVYRLAEGGSGRTVVLCHPAPGAGAFDPDPQQTWARNVTLLAVDRPGYGQSDPMPDTSWASVSSAADDLATVIEQLVGEPIGVAGWSAGGRVALALAARRPDLVDRVVLIGTPAPHEQVPWMPTEQQAALDALRDLAPDAARSALSQQLAPLTAGDTRVAAGLSMLASSAADDAALALPGARDRLAAMLQAAFAQGPIGLAGDIAGYYLQPWCFAPEAVLAKTLLLYGSKDPVAGSRHGAWWQKHLPNARLEVVPGAGHLLVLAMWARVLSHLAPGCKRSV